MGLSEGLLRLGGDGISTTSVPSPSCNKKISVCYYQGWQSGQKIGGFGFRILVRIFYSADSDFFDILHTYIFYMK